MVSDETARLAALRRYRILDTEPDQAFDDLTLLALQICGTPIALITLLDQERQWFKSRRGTGATETARSIAFCAHTIQQNDLFVIPDTLAAERFRENRWLLASSGSASMPGHRWSRMTVTRWRVFAYSMGLPGRSPPSSRWRSPPSAARPSASWS